MILVVAGDRRLSWEHLEDLFARIYEGSSAFLHCFSVLLLLVDQGLRLRVELFSLQGEQLVKVLYSELGAGTRRRPWALEVLN